MKASETNSGRTSTMKQTPASRRNCCSRGSRGRRHKPIESLSTSSSQAARTQGEILGRPIARDRQSRAVQFQKGALKADQNRGTNSMKCK